jgi:hypothetical protein
MVYSDQYEAWPEYDPRYRSTVTYDPGFKGWPFPVLDKVPALPSPTGYQPEGGPGYPTEPGGYDLQNLPPSNVPGKTIRPFAGGAIPPPRGPMSPEIARILGEGTSGVQVAAPAPYRPPVQVAAPAPAPLASFGQRNYLANSNLMPRARPRRIAYGGEVLEEEEDPNPVPNWLDYYRQLLSKIPEIGLPPRDEVLLSPGQTQSSLRENDLPFGQPLGENVEGIYGRPKSQPAGDVVLPPSEEYQLMPFKPNSRRGGIWMSPAKRMWDDLNIQGKLGGLPQVNDFQSFMRGYSQGDLLHGFGQQKPSYLRNISTSSPQNFLSYR